MQQVLGIFWAHLRDHMFSSSSFILLNVHVLYFIQFSCCLARTGAWSWILWKWIEVPSASNDIWARMGLKFLSKAMLKLKLIVLSRNIWDCMTFCGDPSVVQERHIWCTITRWHAHELRVQRTGFTNVSSKLSSAVVLGMGTYTHRWFQIFFGNQIDIGKFMVFVSF